MNIDTLQQCAVIRAIHDMSSHMMLQMIGITARSDEMRLVTLLVSDAKYLNFEIDLSGNDSSSIISANARLRSDGRKEIDLTLDNGRINVDCLDYLVTEDSISNETLGAGHD
ncbi:MAG: hypothetical protein AB7F96_02725 [Beijerinckiaceae bacterium]